MSESTFIIHFRDLSLNCPLTESFRSSKHAKTHSRAFQCSFPDCDSLGFYRLRDLNRHSSVHGLGEAGMSRWFCEFDGCEYASVGFSRKDNCMRHMRLKHRQGELVHCRCPGGIPWKGGSKKFYPGFFCWSLDVWSIGIILVNLTFGLRRWPAYVYSWLAMTEWNFGGPEKSKIVRIEALTDDISR